MRGKDSGLQRTPAACVKAPAGKIASGRGPVARSRLRKTAPQGSPHKTAAQKTAAPPGDQSHKPNFEF